jgi:hypothetical protein
MVNFLAYVFPVAAVDRGMQAQTWPRAIGWFCIGWVQAVVLTMAAATPLIGWGAWFS